MHVTTICERHQETGISNAGHLVEKPLRCDRSAGPRTVPARRINFFAFSSPCRARARCSRMSFPWEMPIRLAVSSSQVANSFVIRKVIVWPIRQKHKHNGQFVNQAAQLQTPRTSGTDVTVSGLINSSDISLV